MFGAVETGGTTTRVALAERADRFRMRDAFATGVAVDTTARIVDFFAGHRLTSLGVAAFGPIDVDPESPGYGTLLETPKAGWSRFQLGAELQRALGVPVRIETDVNAAALAEQAAARAAGMVAGTLVYVTVGTGIGAGVVLEGRAHHGALHPEAGHLRVQRVPGDAIAGVCPIHGDCLEGLASARAIEERVRLDPSSLPPDHPAWTIETDYLAQLVIAITGLLAPHRIVLGGGVMRSTGLLERVRARAVELSRGYAPSLATPERAAVSIVGPMLGSDSGLRGALLLAAS